MFHVSDMLFVDGRMLADLDDVSVWFDRGVQDSSVGHLSGVVEHQQLALLQ